MQSWKARLLMLLSTMAMVLAISMPVAAQAQICPPWDVDCDQEEESSWSDDWSDYLDGDEDEYYDTFDVGGAECVGFYDEDDDGYDDVVCFDEYGNVVYED